MSVIRKVVKVGNSLGITLPSELINEKKIKQGDPLSIELDSHGDIVIKQISNEVTGMGLDRLSKYRGIISADRAKEWTEATNEERNNW